MTARVIGIVLAAAIAAVLGGFAPAGASDDTLTPTLESWYQPDPACALPIGCLTTAAPVAPPAEVAGPSPYPAGTLHVGLASGAETARSYLVFPVHGLGRITSATLTVPLDVDPANGSALPDTAEVRACLATGELSDVDGAITDPPTVDCTNSAVLEYVDTPVPQLTGDLSPLLIGLSTSPGIALLPVVADDAAAAWHVTFSAHDRADEGATPPASLRIAVADGDAAQPAAPPSTVSSSPPATVSLPDLGPVSVPTPAPGMTTVTTLLSAPTAITASPITQTVGFAYPGLLLLPLLALVIVPLVARVLTTNLEPKQGNRTT